MPCICQIKSCYKPNCKNGWRNKKNKIETKSIADNVTKEGLHLAYPAGEVSDSEHNLRKD